MTTPHKDMKPSNLRFKHFIEGALKQVPFIQGLEHELARMSALNRLLGYLEGGLEIYELYEQQEKHHDRP